MAAGKTWLLVLAGMAALGAASRPLAGRAVRQDARAGGEISTEEAGRGGLRAALADVFWLRAHVEWEQRRAPAVLAYLQMTTAANPRPIYFWVNGARMIAHDMSAWRIEAAEVSGAAVDERAIEAQQAARALHWLDAAERPHGGDVRLLVERASITLIRLHDLRGAAELYAAAAERPGAPYFTGRLAAELWRRNGEPEKAYRWLCRWYPTLPKEDESAEADLVLARMKTLERDLGIPVATRDP
jgi:hypothetical protein